MRTLPVLLRILNRSWKGQKMGISKYFKASEFNCKCHSCKLIKPPKELLVILDDVREYFGKPVHIMSGYRCPMHNARVGGAEKSQHKLGTAADIQVKDTHPEIVQRYLLNKYPNDYGIGRYSTFTHIDVRSYRARW